MLWGLEALGVFELGKDWWEWENQSPTRLPALVRLKLMPQTDLGRFLMFLSCFIHTVASCFILISRGYSTCTWGEFLSFYPSSQISSCWCSTTHPIIPRYASIWCHLFPGLTRLPRESGIRSLLKAAQSMKNLNQDTFRVVLSLIPPFSSLSFTHTDTCARTHTKR